MKHSWLSAGWLALLLAVPLNLLSQTCVSYNTTLGPFPFGQNDNTGHASGFHGFANVMTGSCTYMGPAGSGCSLNAQANSTSGASDNGVLTNPLLSHQSTHSDANGIATTGNGMGATVDAEGAGGVLGCGPVGCSFGVTINGSGNGTGYSVNFSSTPLWSSKNHYTNICPGRHAAPVGGHGGAVGCTVPIAPACPTGEIWGTTACACVPGNTPIIIDTTGHGFHFTDPSTACVTFKWGNKLVCTSWPDHTSGNAWLVYDRDNDNKVDSADELFGNFTPHSDGGVKNHPNPNGFLALQWYDRPAQGGNGDLVIDSQDAIWPKLKLWIDTHCYLTPKEPCSARPYELFSLPDKGIYSLSLMYNASDVTDQWHNNFEYKAVVNPEEVEHGERQKSRDQKLAYEVVVATEPK